MLETALALARMGFYVFPLEEHSKLPHIDGWQRKASRDPEQIRRWWTCPVMGTPQAYNIGISTTHYWDGKADRALLVVDVDNKNGKCGDDVLLELELGGCEFPPTLEALTPTGGRHLIYVVDKPVKQGANVLGPGLDIRSRGGFIVAAGSRVEAGEYRWKE